MGQKMQQEKSPFGQGSQHGGIFFGGLDGKIEVRFEQFHELVAYGFFISARHPDPDDAARMEPQRDQGQEGTQVGHAGLRYNLHFARMTEGLGNDSGGGAAVNALFVPYGGCFFNHGNTSARLNSQHHISPLFQNPEGIHLKRFGLGTTDGEMKKSRLEKIMLRHFSGVEYTPEKMPQRFSWESGKKVPAVMTWN